MGTSVGARIVARSRSAFWGQGGDGGRLPSRRKAGFLFLSWDLVLSTRKLALRLALSPGDILRELRQSRGWEMWPLSLILSPMGSGHPPHCQGKNGSPLSWQRL